MKKYVLILSVVILAVLMSSILKRFNYITNGSSGISSSPSSGSTSLANPASVYCKENGGTLEIVTQEDGSQYGLCHLDGYSCEEWAFFRSECPAEVTPVETD